MRTELNLAPDRLAVVWRHRQAIYRPRIAHKHEELEFNLIIAGRASYLIEDRRHNLDPGSLVWLFPDQDHLLVDGTIDFEMWICVLKPRLVNRLARREPFLELNERRIDSAARRLPAEDATFLERILERAQGYDDAPEMCEVMAAAATVEAWRMHIEAPRRTGDIDVHPAVERAVWLIHRGEDDGDLDQLAIRCGLSASRLSRLFKQQMGLSLSNFRQSQRLDRFLALYGQGRRRTMTEAAFEAGFGSYPQFHRVFVERIGCSPSAYRRRLRDEHSARREPAAEPDLPGPGLASHAPTSPEPRASHRPSHRPARLPDDDP